MIHIKVQPANQGSVNSLKNNFYKGDQTMLFDKVKEIIAETVNIDEAEVKAESTLKEDLGIDSLDAVEISIALEDSFEISIPQEKVAEFTTVQDIVDYIAANKE